MTNLAKADALPSFQAIYLEHAGFVWRIVRRLGVPDADAEDVCQEVFVVVHRKLGGFAGRSTLRTWIYGIAFRTASDFRRRAHVRHEVATESPDLGSQAAEQPLVVDRERARKALDNILAQLDEDKRAVFVFYEIEEVPMLEVAAIVDCPVQTAYSRLRIARQQVLAATNRLAKQEFLR